MRKHGNTPSRRDKHVTLAAISPPGVARGRFVGGQQSGLAGSKRPPLFTREASSYSSQGRRQGEPWGASPRPSAPTNLPVGAGGAGVGMRHQPHSARSCELALRPGGGTRAPEGGASCLGVGRPGTGALSTPDLLSFWACVQGPLPTGCGCGVRPWGPGCPWHLLLCRVPTCVVRASRVRGTRCP